MVKDECSYLCSALVSARSPSTALETALELAQLLSSKKSRTVLWQTFIYRESSGSSSTTTTTTTTGTTTTTTIASTTVHEDQVKQQQQQQPPPLQRKTILDAILDVIACVAANGGERSRSTHRHCTNGTSSSSIHSSINSNSSLRSLTTNSKNARTKSARRKLKQQQPTGPHDVDVDVAVTTGASSSWSSPKHIKSLPELSQTLAIIVYFISLDCTLSKDHSVAVMGAASKPAWARTIRSIVMNHSKALQGILHLCLQQQQQHHHHHQRERKSSQPTTIAATNVYPIPSSVASSVSFASSLSTPGSTVSNLTVPDVDVQPGIIRRHVVVQRNVSVVAAAALASSLSSPENRMSSRPLHGDHWETATTPISSGDPTKAGRLKRRNRKHQQHLPTGDAASTLRNQKLPAVPEGGDLLEGLDCPWDKTIVPPPSRKRAKQIISSDLDSSTNDGGATVGTNESSLISEPWSPSSRKGAVAFKLPTSPGDRSVASSVVSVESTNSIVVNARTAQKLHHLKAAVHFTSSSLVNKQTVTPLREDSIAAVSDDYPDPWVSLLCLESLDRVIAGKEGDGNSCLTDEMNDAEMSPDDEETNPLLQTNRRLGNSGIIPLLSKYMSQGLTEVPQSCRQNWSNRMFVVASLIDNACLFDKANRRAFVEHDDTFSFDDDSIRKSKGEGLVFHILQFLHVTLSHEATNMYSSEDPVSQKGVRLLALRTLTSLTHENALAAEQMVALYSFHNKKFSVNFDEEGITTTRGVEVLAKLVVELEDCLRIENGGLQAAAKHPAAREEESHRFDSTIFCLNTLSNIIEGPGVRQILMETRAMTQKGTSILWIRWLCQWLVEQTSGFQESILSIGEKRNPRESERELQHYEDDKLVAAGNGCVLLACLMKDPEVRSDKAQDASSTAIRKVILEELPTDKNGKPSGMTFIINTLKAFCNFYHFSLGELSLAIVAPVTKLIDHVTRLKSS